MKKTTIVSLGILLFLGSYITIFLQTTKAASTNPTVISGNPTCADLGYPYELKIDPPNPGSYSIGNGIFTRSTSDNKHLDRSSNIGVDTVIVKGGNSANVYYYTPESKGDTNLVSPNNVGGQIANISHLSICYDYEVDVNKTANTSFTRQYLRTINKITDKTGLTLNLGETGIVNYLVMVNSAGYTDKDRLVTGNVEIYNPDPKYPAIIETISDIMSGYSFVTLNCGPITFPYQMNTGETLVCSYQISLTGPINTINEAKVTTSLSSKVGGNSTTANVFFGKPTNIVDNNVNITDSMYTPATGWTCSIQNTLPCTFSYPIYVGPFYQPTNDFELNNIATLTTTDSHTSATASAKVFVHLFLPPPGGGNTGSISSGCTYTLGYRKTHSKYGPTKKSDPIRNMIGPDTIFFLSNQSRYGVLQTAPKQGNVYYILAHQYIAAKLNKLAGATITTQVNSAISYAETFFSLYTPSSNFTKSVKETATQNAGILDQYNNGLTGPGHCD